MNKFQKVLAVMLAASMSLAGPMAARADAPEAVYVESESVGRNETEEEYLPEEILLTEEEYLSDEIWILEEDMPDEALTEEEEVLLADEVDLPEEMTPSGEDATTLPVWEEDLEESPNAAEPDAEENGEEISQETEVPTPSFIPLSSYDFDQFEVVMHLQYLEEGEEIPLPSRRLLSASPSQVGKQGYLTFKTDKIYYGGEWNGALVQPFNVNVDGTDYLAFCAASWMSAPEFDTSYTVVEIDVPTADMMKVAFLAGYNGACAEEYADAVYGILHNEKFMGWTHSLISYLDTGDFRTYPSGTNVYYDWEEEAIRAATENIEYLLATDQELQKVVRRTHLYGTKPYEGDDGSSQPVYWIAVDPDIPTGLLRAKKVSGNTVLTEGNSCYDFSGIQFKVYTDEACSAEALDADGEPILLISQADGLTDYVSVEPGTYYVQEVEESLTGKGWKYNPEPTKVVVPEDGAEEALIAEVENQPLNDPLGIEITKIAKDPAYAVADLSNAEYTIQYYAGQYTIDTLPEEADATWVVKTAKVGEHYIAALHDTYMVQGEAVFGKDASGQYVLPLGTITVKETKAPAGFSLNGSTLQLTGGDGSDSADERVLYNFIDDQGVCSVQSGNQILSAEDGVKVESLEENARGDLSFTKKLVKTDGTEEPLGGIPFVITSQETGESHYVVTDANGNFSSAAVSPEKMHTTNTNGYDDILKPYDDADQVIPASVIENLSYAGIWFGAKPVDDTKGALPLGTYEVRELKTEANKDLDMVTKTFEVTEENTVADDEILNPEIPSSTLSVKKVSAAADLTAENDSYDFSGIQFKVYTDNACHTEAKKKDGGEILLTSDKNGETESIFMEPGTYYVQEVEESLTGKGWIYNANPTEVVIPERGHAKALVAEISNKPMHSAGIQIIKVDESGAVSDGSDLSGAEYTINFYKGQYTKDNRPEVADATWVIQTIKDGDDYIAELDDEHLVSGKAVYGIMEDGRFILPLGTITIEETKAPEGFTTEGATIRLTDGDGTDETDGVVLYNFVDRDGTCHVVSGNQAVPAGNSSSFTSKDSFKRGELTFTKKILGTERTMAGIPFKIKNVETQETHYVVTDANGVFSSAVKLPDVLHTTNTNGYDDILKPYDDADQVIPASVIANLDPAGVWFGDAEVNDAFCSMPVGYYEVTELKTDANKTMAMVTKTFKVEEGPVVTEGGDVYNVEVKLHTTALDADSMTHYALAEDRNVIIDTVYNENVEVGQTYILTATAMVTENGTSRELEGFLGKKTFKAESENGSVEVRIVFDASDLAGKTITVYEEMRLDDGKEDGKGTFVAEHKELSDENQKIYYPGIQTNAKDADTNVGLANADTDITITDTVSYKNLNTDKRYILSGMLVDKATEYPILDDSGNPVTASKEFRPESSDGEVELTFTFQGASLAGTTAVVFEELKNAGKTFAVHADIEDEAQTVYIPKIHTTAVNKNTGIKTNECGETVLVDTVAYTNLLPFKTYTLKAKVYDKTTGELTDFTGEKTFTPSESSGTVDVEISLNTEGYEGHTFVAYETAFYGEVQIADHSEPDDEKQTTVVPKIGTVAKDAQTEIQLAALGETIFIDTVSYENLVPGETYVMKASLFDKTNGELTSFAGEQEFVAAEGGKGTVDVEIKLDTTGLESHDLVCYEDGYYKEVLVATHKDKDDEGQTIHVAEIGTVAVNKETNIKTNALGETVILDTVEYKNLIPGKEYTLKAQIYDQTSGALTEFKAEKTFTPEEADGSVDVEIPVNTEGFEGHDLVAYETAYYGEIVVADHQIPDSPEQTTEVPKIGTVAKDAQTEIQTAALGETSIIDTVSYENLVAGEEYTMKASLFDKTEGKLTEYTGEATFTAAEGGKGTVDVEIALDTTNLAGHDLVCYEDGYYKEVMVASHKDKDDEGQTIHVAEIGTVAVNKETNIKTNALGKTVILDTVEYKNLIPGKEYTLKAQIYDQTSGALTEFKAEKTFTPEEADGSVDVEIPVNTEGLEGHDLVAYETAYYGEIVVADHQIPDSPEQTTEVPKIGTVAKDAQTEIQLAALGETTIIDTVSYENLLPGETYVMKASVFDKTKGELTSFIGEQEFVAAEGGKGTVDVEIKLDTTGLAGHDLVCYENAYYKEVLVESHENPDDEGQTIHVAEIGTVAVNKETNIKTNALGETVIVDTVEYKNLIPGKTYTLKTSIYDATSGELTDFTGEQEFTPESADGSVDVEITVNTLGLEGHDLVAFEEAYYGEVLIADHSEPEDEKQTTEVAKIGTVAKDAQTEMQLAALDETTFIDTVSYENLVSGETYVMKASLYDKTKGELTSFTGEQEFVAAEGGKGTVDVEIKLDTTGLAGHDLVCYENAYYKEVLVESHESPDDEGQTIHVAEIGTVAVNKETNIKTNALGETIIKDTVEYKNLIPGKEYTLKAKVYDQTSGALTEFKAEKTFTPEEADGSVDVEIPVNTEGLEGHDLVAYETAYYGEIVVADHQIPDSPEQTTEVPKIGTVAKDAQTEMQLAALGETTFIDTVSYENLVAGEEYTMKASLFDKTEGKLMEYTGEATFTVAEGGSGTVDVEIALDTTNLAGHDLVCYEDGYYKEVLVASHKDKDDEGQTIHVAEIGTVAVNKETNIKTNALGETVILDTVEYKNLIPGKEYTLKAQIYDQTSGALTEFKAEKTFTPEEADGSVEVEIPVNTEGLEGHDLVAYETAYYGEIVVADHQIPDSPEQTTEVPKIGTVAKDAQTEMQLAALGETTFIDTVSYENLVAGEEYTMKASLFDKTEGKLTEYTGEMAFTAAEGGKGTVDVEIKLDTTGLANHDLVCYEDGYYKEVLVATHKDKNDEGQMIHVAEIGTVAVNKETNIKTNALGKTVILDTVEYKNLIPGKEYTLKAQIYDQTSGALTEFKAEKTFTPEEADGSVEVEIPVNTEGLEGHDLVAYETAYYGEIVVADHQIPDSPEQTTGVLKIGTTAKDKQTGNKQTANGKTVIVDTVKYTGLEIGQTYRLEAVLYDKDAKEETEFKANYEFTPETKDGKVDVEIEIDTRGLDGHTLVVLEKAYYGETLIADHAKPDDEEQTVYVPAISTSAYVSTVDGEKGAYESSSFTIVDRVFYENLVIGETYTVSGILMDQTTGTVIMADGAPVTASTSFTAENTEGSADVIFTFDATGMGTITGREIVVFEDLILNGVSVSSHDDFYDKDQTITIFVDEVDTSDPGKVRTFLTFFLGALAISVLLFMKRKSFLVEET